MEESPYSNREIRGMFTRLEEKLDEHSNTHQLILNQVKYTNGRVRWNEKMIYMAMGALTILTPLVTWALVEISTIDEKIAGQLDGYEIQIVE